MPSMTNRRRAALRMMGTTVVILLAGCSNGGTSDLLRSRVQASFEVTAHVTYQMVFDRGQPGNPVGLSVIQGPWGRRSDGSVTTDTRTFSSTLMDLSDGQYVCGPDIGEGGGCIRAGDAFKDPDELFSNVFDFTFSFRKTFIESDAVEIVDTSTREVAGLEADCFQVTSAEPAQEDAEICLSNEGILLSLDASSAETRLTLIANTVDRDVAEDDFTLPYPIVEGP